MDLNALAALWQAARGPRFRKPRPASRVRRAFTNGILLLLAVYLASVAFWVGTATGGGMQGLDPCATGNLLWRVPLALGVAGALWDGGCVVDPAPCRPYFVALRTLILAEGMLGFTTPIKRGMAGMGLAFSLGMAWGRPALFSLGLGYAVLAIMWTACLERVINGLVPAGIFRQRTFLVWILVLSASLAFLRGRPTAPPFIHALEVAWSLPGVELVRFWQTRDGAHLALPVGASLVLLAITAAFVARDLAMDRRPGTALAGGRAWAGSSPLITVARLQFHNLLASRSGQMRFFVLLLSVVLTKEPEIITIGTLKSPHAWVGAAAGLTFGAVMVVPLCNLLGYDRGGVRTWWRAPILDRDLLLGKILGCAAYAAIAATILLALVTQAQIWRLVQHRVPGGISLEVVRSTDPLRAGETLAMAMFLVAIFLWWAGSGLERSLRGAWPQGLDNYGVKLDFDEEKMARVGTLLAPLAWMGLVFGLTLALGWRTSAAAMTLLALLATLRLRWRLNWAASFLAKEREGVTLALTAGG